MGIERGDREAGRPDTEVVDERRRRGPGAVNAPRYSVWPGYPKPASYKVALWTGLVTTPPARPASAFMRIHLRVHLSE